MLLANFTVGKTENLSAGSINVNSFRLLCSMLAPHIKFRLKAIFYGAAAFHAFFGLLLKRSFLNREKLDTNFGTHFIIEHHHIVDTIQSDKSMRQFFTNIVFAREANIQLQSITAAWDANVWKQLNPCICNYTLQNCLHLALSFDSSSISVINSIQNVLIKDIFQIAAFFKPATMNYHIEHILYAAQCLIYMMDGKHHITCLGLQHSPKMTGFCITYPLAELEALITNTTALLESVNISADQKQYSDKYPSKNLITI